MDKRTTFHRLESMMFGVPEKEINLAKLRRLIIMNIGSSERTVYACLKIMLEMGMIEDLGNTKFKILKNKL